jgi:hypothetical protein
MTFTDNATKPVLHLKLGARLAAALTPPAAERLAFIPPVCEPAARKSAAISPREPPVSWANYREVLQATPPPTFDPAVASPEDWQAYNATLSKRQRRARSFKWTISMCACFAGCFGARGEENNQRAFKFAMARHRAIIKAFKRGDKRGVVLQELANLWSKEAK